MDTLQSIGVAILHGITSWIPVDESAHKLLLNYFLDWPQVSEEFNGALYLSSLLALLVFLRHDWASIISSGLRCVLTWTKPMMLDERMGFFLLLTFVPAVVAWYYAPALNLDELKSPVWIASLLIATGLPLWFSESMNRRTKATSYWNSKDSFVLGLCQITFLIPGVGRQAGALTAAYLLNYQKEAALKFTMLSFAPILALNAFTGMRNLHFHDANPATDMSWMSFWVAFTVCFFTTLLTLNFLVKHAQTKRLTGAILYRCMLGAAVFGVYWFRSRG